MLYCPAFIKDDIDSLLAMLKLTSAQLNSAFTAIQHHGYVSFFPLPPELPLIDSVWSNLRPVLEGKDLGTYQCYEPLKAFVPKSRLNVRFVSFLHPFDLLFYTALVMNLRDSISAARLPLNAYRVFSFRSERATRDMLLRLSQDIENSKKGSVRKQRHGVPNL
jgi:hypothetical protein